MLAIVQFGFAVIIVTFLQFISLMWLQASFRPEIFPDIICVLNDYGWSGLFSFRRRWANSF